MSGFEVITTKVQPDANLLNCRLSYFLLLALLGICLTTPVRAENSIERITHALVRIKATEPGKEPVMGTGILVEASDNSQAWLVTAAHVFKSIQNDEVDLLFRTSEGSDAKELEVSFRIRVSGTDLYRVSNDHDIAALLIGLPEKARYRLVSKRFFATESELKNSGAGMGSRLVLLGYPYGWGFNNTGYAIARSGIISSFPLFPVSSNPVFLVDFEIFPGFSGGVALIKSEKNTMIAGMVSQEVFLEEIRPGKNHTLLKRHGLGLARVIHSDVIKKFIEDLD